MAQFKSRHPKINYWFWDEKTITDKQYLKDIDILSEYSTFDFVFLTQRGNFSFWDPKLKPIFQEVVEYAHTKGIKLGIQFWQKGHMDAADVTVSNAAAVVTEYEATLGSEKVIIHTQSKNVRFTDVASPLKSELLFVGAFKKLRDGFYEDGTFIDITQDAKIEYTDDPAKLNVIVDRADLKGYTVYVMVAHYHKYADMFGDATMNDFKAIMDFYRDTPFDGIVVDEFRSMNIDPLQRKQLFRERIYGKAFQHCYREQTGDDLIQTMFEMRYCPEYQDAVRMKAINNYFDVFRKGVLKNEKFIADYAVKIFGEDVFLGLHNTYHNHLQHDEIWHTGCNWWELPRKYAQTDEEIGHPIRMGIACGCPENLVYDMWYHWDKQTFFEKAIRDARYNSRIHYHAINDGSQWGTDTGSREFLEEIEKIERKITLLNVFDPVLPKMELLVVFGFPALCNWYPDETARNKVDINGKLNIEKRVNDLWEKGYLNALAPSDAIVDGRITMKDGKYDYCGHNFDKLLYLYPEYSKKEVTDFLETAATEGYELKIIGEYTHDFEGKPANINIAPEIFLEETADIATAMKLEKNKIHNGCVLEDGSVVISDYDSVMNDVFCTYNFEIDGHQYETEFRGTFALKTDENGNIMKLTAGNLKYIKKDGEILLSNIEAEDYIEV